MPKNWLLVCERIQPKTFARFSLIEVGPAAAEDELEAQWLLTYTARITALSSSLTAQFLQAEPVEFTDVPAKNRTLTKKRDSRSTAALKTA